VDLTNVPGLQWGELFVLALVLVGVGFAARVFWKWFSEREEKRDEWLKVMVDQSREEGSKRTDAWVAMVEKLAGERRQGQERMAAELTVFTDALQALSVTQTEAVGAISQLRKSHEKAEGRSQERHAELLKAMQTHNGE